MHITVAELEHPGELSRAKRLKLGTRASHERLDASIMAAQPFASRARYGQFVRVQHAFHEQIERLYDDPALDRLLPDLAGRRRLGLIEQDLTDLGLAASASSKAPVFPAGEAPDIPTALGWLYVAEGSNLGAAFLLKDAEKLGLSETFGACHLAPAPEGRGLRWKTFVAALDDVGLSNGEEERVCGGARAAFAHVQGLTERLMSRP